VSKVQENRAREKGTSTKNEEIRRKDKIKEEQEGDAIREKGLEKKDAGGKVQGRSARDESKNQGSKVQRRKT
jgi:hypothetical protein